MITQGWHPADIIAAVRKQGTTLQRLSREHGFSREAMNKSLTTCFPRAHRIIADLIGVSRHELWPQWYDARDVRRSPAAAKRERARRIADERRAA